MKQYCRYCAYLVTGNGIWCKEHEKPYSEAYCKKPNNCKDFLLCDVDPEWQDAFHENLKGYKPREHKPKFEDKQIRLDIAL